MTQLKDSMSNIERIRQETERRKKICECIFERDSDTYYQGKAVAYGELLPFLDSLPEEKPSEDLEGKQMIKELKERIVGLDNNGNPIAAAPPDIPMIVEKVNEIIRYLNATQRK